MLEGRLPITEPAFLRREDDLLSGSDIERFDPFDGIAGFRSVCPDILNRSCPDATGNKCQVLHPAQAMLHRPADKIVPYFPSGGPHERGVSLAVEDFDTPGIHVQHQRIEVLEQQEVAPARKRHQRAGVLPGPTDGPGDLVRTGGPREVPRLHLHTESIVRLQ